MRSLDLEGSSFFLGFLHDYRSAVAGGFNGFDQGFSGDTALGCDHCLIGHAHVSFGNTFNTCKCGPHFCYAGNASPHAGYCQVDGFCFCVFRLDFGRCGVVVGRLPCDGTSKGKCGQGAECECFIGWFHGCWFGLC
jgi:hypothetical protein